MILSFFYIREWKRFPFFYALLILTLFLGTVGLTGITLVSEQVQQKLTENAKNLLTSDFVVSARRQLDATELATSKNVLSSVAKDSYRVIDLYTMATHMREGQARLVELRAVEGNYPFYGTIRLKNAGVFDASKLVISQDLADLWSFKIGDELKIGDKVFSISDVVVDDTSIGLRGFSLAPRIYFPLGQLEGTGLLKPGVTGSFANHYRLPNGLDPLPLKKKIYADIPDPAVKVGLPEESSEQTGRMMGIIKNFMALSALVGLILSLVGVFYLYQSHLQARLKDLCLMNLMGLSKTKIILQILIHFSLLFAVTSLLQMATLIPIYKALIPSLSSSLGLDLPLTLDFYPVLKLLPYLYGLSLSILVPLMLGLFRTSMGLQLKSAKISLGVFRYYDFVPFLILLWFFSYQLAHSLKVGSIFFGCLLLVFCLSTLIIKLLQFMIRKMISGRGLLNPSIPYGLALRNLTRSGHKLTLSFLSLALGTTLISLILQLDSMIAKEFQWDANKPGLFLFDIQEEQVDQLVKFAADRKTPLEALSPMIRGRLEKVNGEKFVRQKSSYSMRNKEEDEDNRMRSNGLNITYRAGLTPSETLAKGTPFPGPYDGKRLPLISLEKRWAERMNLSIGDKLTFDIQGIEFEGQVHNFREVKWTSFTPNFFVSLEPGTLDLAPKTYLAILPSGPKDQKMSFQREAIPLFPNISFIDVEELVGKMSVIFDKSKRAVEIISWLSLSVGLIILYGLSHDQVYRRHYDLALLKSLGMSGRSLKWHLMLEFGSLFTAAGTLGFFTGWLIAQVIGIEVFKVSLSVDWPRLIIPGIFLSILCLMTVLVASWRATEVRPRQLLADS